MFFSSTNMIFKIIVLVFFFSLNSKGNCQSSLAQELEILWEQANQSENSDTEANVFFDKAIDLAYEAKSDSAIVAARYEKSRYYFNRGKYQESFTIISPALKELSPSLSYVQHIDVHMIHGWTLGYQGNYIEGQEHFYKAIKIAQENDDFGKEFLLTTGLARIYQVQGFYKEVVEIYEPYIRRKDDLTVKQLSIVSTAIGNAKWQLGELDQAKKNWLNCIEVLENDTTISLRFRNTTIGNVLHNLSNSYKEDGILDSAIYCANRSLEMAEEINNDHSISSSLIELSSLLMETEDLDLVETYLLRAQSLVLSSTSDNRTLNRVYEQLSDYYFRTKAYKKSAETYRNYIDGYIELNNELNTQKITELKMEQEFAQERLVKEQELERKAQQVKISQLETENESAKNSRLLWLLGGLLVALGIGLLAWRRDVQSKRKIATKNEALTASVKEKELLLREIHHRVKNNLQMVSSLLKSHSRNFDDPKSLKAFKEGENRVYSMALIHEKLYQGQDIGSIRFEDYLKELVDHFVKVNDSESEVKVDFKCDDISLDIDTAVPLGLIANELVTNSFKHAYEGVENPELNIVLKELDEGGSLKMEISDNGAGLPQDYDWKRSRSMGMRLVNNLSKQLLGSVEHFRSENITTFSVVFKDAFGRQLVD